MQPHWSAFEFWHSEITGHTPVLSCAATPKPVLEIVLSMKMSKLLGYHVQTLAHREVNALKEEGLTGGKLPIKQLLPRFLKVVDFCPLYDGWPTRMLTLMSVDPVLSSPVGFHLTNSWSGDHCSKVLIERSVRLLSNGWLIMWVGGWLTSQQGWPRDPNLWAVIQRENSETSHCQINQTTRR